MRLQRVVIGSDFSEASFEAARWTTEQFAGDAEVILVHVVDPGRDALSTGASPRETAEASDTALRCVCELRDELKVGACAVEVAVGSPAVEIARVAEERNADLIAVGKHGRSKRMQRLLGTTAERLVSESPVPVLLATGMGEAQPRNILVAVQNDGVKEFVVRWALWLSDRFEAGCVALSVVGSTAHTHLMSMAGMAHRGHGVPGQEFREGFSAGPNGWITDLVLADPAAHLSGAEAAAGDPAQHIIRAAERLRSDLIVLGSRRHGAARRAVLGSVARKVIRFARCPVLVVKEPEDAALESATLP